MKINLDLLRKYNVPVPRYTSYPTVPYWNEQLDIVLWEALLKRQFQATNATEGISIYIHLPFCESLCTYCGCNKKITKQHNVEETYIQAILKEWNYYLTLLGNKPIIKELHLGGGTPTFFSPENLRKLIEGIFKNSTIAANAHEFGFEGHPNNTTEAHLKTLYELGFTRVSYGVQDNNEEVQKIINRIQPYENVVRAINQARKIGYQSVNFDLIYGLPRQSMAYLEKTVEATIRLKPDRIAFYSYAHVPWTSKGQRLFDEKDLPDAELKLQLYQKGRLLFEQAGYEDIGMDHFALPDDSLFQARKEGWLFRNFMGYTTHHTTVQIGLGVSAISDAGRGFAQNEKTLQLYYEQVNKQTSPIRKGYLLNDEDVVFRKHIMNLSCLGETHIDKAYQKQFTELCLPELQKLEQDGIVKLDHLQVSITPLGHHFIRLVCRAFDLHLLRRQLTGNNPVFSKAL